MARTHFIKVGSVEVLELEKVVRARCEVATLIRSP